MQTQKPHKNEFIALVAAGGAGTRLGAAQPKQFLSLGGRSLLARVCGSLAQVDNIAEIVVIHPPGQQPQGLSLNMPLTFITGGATRTASVQNGLAYAKAHGYHWVLIHDAARPFTRPQLFNQVMAQAREHGAAIAAWPSSDTVKRAGAEGFVAATLAREHIWLAQTPQAFKLAPLMDALAKAPRGLSFTDEAGLLEHLGHKVKLVAAARGNFKITTSEDWQMAKELCAWPRIGLGFDVHALTPGRGLILAGVEVPYHLGLAGHSDADVLTHALMDALLSAAGLGDIGRHFPDSDQAYAGISSLSLLRKVLALLTGEGFKPVQVNAVLMAQAPKIAPYVEAMRANWATALALPLSLVNIAATTTEKLGFIGQGQGMAAQAQAMLQEI